MKVTFCGGGYVELKRWDFLPVLLWLSYAVFESIVFTVIGNPQPTYIVATRPVLLLAACVVSVVYSIKDYDGGPDFKLTRFKLFFLLIELGSSLYVLIFLAVVSFDGSCDNVVPGQGNLTCDFPWVLSTVILTSVHLFTLLLLYCRRTRNMMTLAQGGDVLADIVVLTFYIEAVATNTDSGETVILVVNLTVAVLSIISSNILLFWHRFGRESQVEDEELAVTNGENAKSGCCGVAAECVKAILN